VTDDAAPAGADDPASVGQGATAAAVDASRLNCIVGYATSRAAIQLKKAFRKHMGPLQLKAVEFSVLVLVAANRQLNQKQLGAALDVSAPNLAVILDRLAERGLVKRERSTVDRRAQHLHLTPAGRALAERAEAIASAMENETLRVLSAAERALLLELLLKIARGRPPRR
jgi:DNA-binding MarR family transcriptional regulator